MMRLFSKFLEHISATIGNDSNDKFFTIGFDVFLNEQRTDEGRYIINFFEGNNSLIEKKDLFQ
jgi:hypothetical protein